MLIPQPSYRVFSGLPPKTHWAPAGVSRRGPRGFWLPSGGEPSAQQTGGRRPGRRDSTVTDVLFSGFPAEMGTRRAVSLRPRRRGRPGMVPDVGLMSARSPGCFCGGVWVWVVSVSDMGKAPWGVCSEGLPVRVVRRRATLPHPVGCSTIAVPGLSFRVRNGTGRLTWAMAAANLLLYGREQCPAGLWRPGNRTADADMSMFRLVARQCSLPSGVVCRRKMRSNRQGLEC